MFFQVKNTLKTQALSRGDHFRFGSVFIKKSNQTEFFFFKKNRNRTEIGSNRPVSVRFGFLGQKPVWLGFSGFGSVFFRFWLGFFGFGSVWLDFFSSFLSVSVRFFGFLLIKPKPNRTEPAGFFKNLIGLIGFFFRLFFFRFSRFNRFFDFFAHP